MNILNDRQHNERVKRMALESDDWAQILAPSLPNLTLGEPLNLLRPQFPHLQNGV